MPESIPEYRVDAGMAVTNAAIWRHGRTLLQNQVTMRIPGNYSEVVARASECAL